jgi:hypothetical protein
MSVGYLGGCAGLHALGTLFLPCTFRDKRGLLNLWKSTTWLLHSWSCYVASAALTDEGYEFLEQDMWSMKYNVASCSIMKALVFTSNNPQNIILGFNLAT